MKVKIDTKERFTVITPEVNELSANMTEDLSNLLLAYIQKDMPHIVLKLDQVSNVDLITADKTAQIQQQFYENNCSMVICCMRPAVEQIFKQLDFFDGMNVTASESEAWDIVQMEEIERELLGD